MSEVTTKNTEKKVLTVAAVLTMLEEGKDRKAIKAHFGLSHADMAKLFRVPALAARRASKEAGFTLVDENGVEVVIPAAGPRKTRTKKVKDESPVTSGVIETAQADSNVGEIATSPLVAPAPMVEAQPSVSENW